MHNFESGNPQRGSSFCRACGSTNLESVLDLGNSPIANSLPPQNSPLAESSYPLHLRICRDCHLGQIGEYETPEQIFETYPYLSSTSKYWLNHAKLFAQEVALMYPQISNGYVLELASNDGYLLKNFKDMGIKVLGVDPARNIAEVANALGIPTLPVFFGVKTAENILASYGYPSLIVANNVAAHVPDIVDFFRGISILCDENTIVSIENPSLGHLLSKKYYDTVYHEHFSYLSVDSVGILSESLGLTLFSAEELPTHGGSLRYWLRKNPRTIVDDSVEEIAQIEYRRGVGNFNAITAFAKTVRAEMETLKVWVEKQYPGSLVGYGAAAKTVTTFFAAGLPENRFEFIVDANNLKQGRRLPGTSIPIQNLESLAQGEARKVLVFPWNLEREIVQDLRKLNSNLEVWVLNPLKLSQY